MINLFNHLWLMYTQNRNKRYLSKFSHDNFKNFEDWEEQLLTEFVCIGQLAKVILYKLQKHLIHGLKTEVVVFECILKLANEEMLEFFVKWERGLINMCWELLGDF